MNSHRVPGRRARWLAASTAAAGCAVVALTASPAHASTRVTGPPPATSHTSVTPASRSLMAGPFATEGQCRSEANRRYGQFWYVRYSCDYVWGYSNALDGWYIQDNYESS